MTAATLAPTGWRVQTLDSLAGLREEWDDLSGRCASATPFQSYAWLDAWWRNYGVPGRLRVLLVFHSGRLVGAAALQRVRRGWCTVLVPLGGALADFTDVLLDDGYADEAARLLAAALRRQRVDFPETRAGAAIERVVRHCRHWRVPASLCLELPATPAEELVRELPGHARKTVRRRLNQITRLGLDTRVVPAEETDRAVADLLRLHALQWAGRGGNPEHFRPRFARHVTESVRGMVDAGQAAILEYRVGDRLVASNLVVIGGGLAGGYLYGAEPALRDDIDIATLLVTSTTELAHRRGCATMSMLRGGEGYKMRWRPQEAMNHRIVLGRGPLAWTYAVAVLARYRAVQAARARLPWLRTVRSRLRWRR